MTSMVEWTDPKSGQVLGYEKLQLSIELLGSDLSRFLERRARLRPDFEMISDLKRMGKELKAAARQAMKKEEVLKLMALSFEAPTEELWRMFSD